jgi:hypothetical protein
MSLPDPASPRKFRRWGLYGPFLVLALAVAAWSAAWVWARGQAQGRMDAAVAGLTRAGYQIGWKSREIGGYPFRMDVTLDDVTVREPSGWALEAPSLEAEAYLYSIGRWLVAAPQGLTFVRPQAGPVAVGGKLIRASLTDFDKRPPSFDFEGVGLTFQPQPGAQPFSLSAADRVEFHLRAGPDDQGGVFFNVRNGKARLSGLFARIAGDKPISIVWNATLTKMSAFSGENWPGAVRHWTEAGGQMQVRQAGVTAGDALIGATQALGAMGEQGVLPRDTAQAAADVAQAREGPDRSAQATLDFQAGRTTLGPVAIGPAPKVYDPR